MTIARSVSRPARPVAVLAGALTVAALAISPVHTAAADPLSACTPSTGAIVGVDFGHWGGPIARGCGVGDASAADVLRDGGFSLSGTLHDGPAFVCRIASGSFRGGTPLPTPAEDPCVNTPPAGAYWSFWYAEPDDTSWTFSRFGAASYHPRPGEVELWRYGATSADGSSGAPPYSPATLRATPPVGRPSTASGRPVGSTTPRVSAPHASPTGARTSVAISRSAAPIPSPRPSSPGASLTSTSAAYSPSIVAATATDPRRSGSSSALAAALGLGAIVALAAAGGAIAWRRRVGRSP